MENAKSPKAVYDSSGVKYYEYEPTSVHQFAAALVKTSASKIYHPKPNANTEELEKQAIIPSQMGNLMDKHPYHPDLIGPWFLDLTNIKVTSDRLPINKKFSISYLIENQLLTLVVCVDDLSLRDSVTADLAAEVHSGVVDFISKINRARCTDLGIVPVSPDKHLMEFDNRFDYPHLGVNYFDLEDFESNSGPIFRSLMRLKATLVDHHTNFLI